MSHRAKIIILWALSLLVILIAALLPPFSQRNDYHHFADYRNLGNIPNVLNVCSNVFFILTGIYGLAIIKRLPVIITLKRMYTVLFIGLLLTAFGSAWYHYHPDNHTLVWDRIPMTLVFMSLMTATIAAKINTRIGVMLFIPLLLAGIGSVLYWQYTEGQGHGDLRWYGLVQFYPLLLLPLIYVLFPAGKNYSGLKSFLPIIGWYLLAKLFEALDTAIYQATGFISGHTLKHVAAAVATFYIVKLVEKSSVSLPVAG